jgi:hypothetical protein
MKTTSRRVAAAMLAAVVLAPALDAAASVPAPRESLAPEHAVRPAPAAKAGSPREGVLLHSFAGAFAGDSTYRRLFLRGFRAAFARESLATEMLDADGQVLKTLGATANRFRLVDRASASVAFRLDIEADTIDVTREAAARAGAAGSAGRIRAEPRTPGRLWIAYEIMATDAKRPGRRHAKFREILEYAVPPATPGRGAALSAEIGIMGETAATRVLEELHRMTRSLVLDSRFHWEGRE